MALAITLVSLAFRAYGFLLLVRVIVSWLNPVLQGPAWLRTALTLLYRLTEPLLAPLRRVVRPIGGTLDLSPAVALVLVEMARLLVVGLLLRI